MRSILGRPPAQDSTHASVSPSEISVFLCHPHHPSSLPEGVQFMLYTLPVNERDVVDGDGFTAYVDTADPRGAIDVPQEVHEALSARDHTRRPQNYKIIDDAGYKVVNGSNNQEILARKYRIRMRGIDAPELKMEYGMESRNELVNLIGRKCVTIHVYEKDKYKRYIGDIYCDGVFIQKEMLKRGFAWYCKTYDKRCEFGQWEGEARDARQGLWLSDNPEKPWEWKRDHPRNGRIQGFLEKRPRKAQSILEAEMDNGSCEALSRMIKEEKNDEEKALEWKKKLESAVAENCMLNDLLRKWKDALQNEKGNVEEKAREWKKELKSVVAENRMLNDLLRKSKEALQNEKVNAEEKAREWKKGLESVVAENRMLNEMLRKSMAALQNEKEACNVEEKARKWKKELESAVAENRMLNDMLRKSKEALQNEKEACNAKENARQWKNELESVVAENHMLNDRLRKLKEALQNEKKGKHRIKQMAIWVGTSMLIVGIAVLCKKCKPPPTPPKKKGVALLYHFVKTRI